MLLDGVNTMTAASTTKAKQSLGGSSSNNSNTNANNVQISNTGIQTLSYLDALKAAVISASMSTDHFHSTVL